VNINSPIRLSNFDDIEKLSEMSDRNFTSAWQTMTNLVGRVFKIEQKNYAEVVEVTPHIITIRTNGKNYKIKVEA